MSDTRRPVLIAAVALVVLFLASAAAIGTLPKPADSGDAVVAWIRDHGSNIRWSTWFVTLALIPFGVFAGLVRPRLPEGYRDVFLIGAAVVGATTAVQSWFLAGMAWHSVALQPATARTLFDVASFWGPVLTAADVVMFGPIVLLSLRNDGPFPRWLGYVTGIFVVEQLIETVTIFGSRGFIAPGGPMNLLLGAGLFLLSFLATAIALPNAP